MKLLREVERLKSAGRIGHLGFSSHDTPENISQMLDSGAFDGMLVQYNLIDESNAEVIRKAHKNGMGVVLMGPVGGGRLPVPPGHGYPRQCIHYCLRAQLMTAYSWA